MASSNNRLHLIVIGGGLAGLAAAISTTLAGHRCTILEKAASFHSVGAGLQLTPNSTRLLRRWDILDALAPVAAIPASLSIRRYDGTRVLCEDPHWQVHMSQLYDAPFWDVHRVDLHTALLERARQLGVTIRTNAEVEDIDFPAAAVRLAVSGEIIRGDVVLGADGLWSRSRDLLLGRSAPPRPTGDLAYRIILSLEDLSHDPELVAWVTKPTVNFWVGPQSHVVGYSVRSGKEFNLVLLCPDDLPEGSMRANANIEEMRELFRGWDPVLTRFLNCVKAVDKWRLMHLTLLETWNHSSGRFTMAGDSCHPMLPYLAQGANSAMEDGAMLGGLLGTIRDTKDVPRILHLYQELRKERVEQISQQALKQRRDFHLRDGSDQESRDEILAKQKPVAKEYPSRWNCPKIQPWLYGYDALAPSLLV
ncbi:FAD binding domain-containing protein [Xylariomycetidae sp. FL2044]|nr:FAD binding domain-containing protein [Xylariomycetidae sp. FL2044]